jgi:hypothetical protein
MGHKPNPARPAALLAWEAAFGTPPPPFLSVSFMQQALDNEAQCKRAGGLSAATRRVLAQIAEGKAIATVPLNAAKLGTHYVREWNGRTYQVAVVHGGFEMDGRMWPSLSAIAKHITGTTWSGPRFFGLTKVQSVAA